MSPEFVTHAVTTVAISGVETADDAQVDWLDFASYGGSDTSLLIVQLVPRLKMDIAKRALHQVLLTNKIVHRLIIHQHRPQNLNQHQLHHQPTTDPVKKFGRWLNRYRVPLLK